MADRNTSKEPNHLFEELLKDRTRGLEELLRFEQDLIDAIPVPVFFQDAECYYLGANRAFAKFLGVDLEKLPESDLYQLLSPGAEDEIRAIDIKVLSQGGYESFEGIVQIPGNQECPVSYHKSVIKRSDGSVVGLATTLFDLTEQRRIQRELQEESAQKQAILDGFPGMLALLDRDTRVIWTNSNYQPLVSENKIFCHELFHGCAKSCKRCPVLKSLKTGKVESGTVEIQSDSDQNKKKTLEVVGTPIKDENGQVTSIFVIGRDVSAQIDLEQQLRHSQKMEAVGTLAGGIAHDFNNVLTPIMGYAEIMRLMAKREGGEESASQQYVGEILLAAKRAKNLVEQILTFSRSREQKELPQYLHPIIKEVLKLMRVTLPATIEIDQQIGTECGMVSIDPVQLHQILINLCTNSAQAIGDKQGKLTVRLSKGELLEEGKEWVELSVADSGSGIDPAIQQRIFEPYFTTKEKSQGTGMGLAMVHGIVTRWGGKIELESEPGQGTVFRLFFPLVEIESQASGEGAIIGLGGDEHILVVDDEEQVAKVTGELLEILGYKVTSCSSAREALLKFSANPDGFDLMITDLTMPYLTGIELCEEAHRRRRNFPVILCTGHSNKLSEETMLAAGFSGWFTKPVSLQNIAATVRTVLDNL
ncbi:MAG: response regulator [Proteobacteria bacterium]|nr:response regulator [Pseudomonadota bacterium]MBU1419177.1 response regulator [Pseudomonadota bacterium]MBU1455135.1 response regulator [Pseudomonadota bacterium]